MTPAEARERFATLVAATVDDVDLSRAALWLAAEEYPTLDVDAYVARLDALAGEVSQRPLTTGPPLGRLLALNAVLFGEQGFVGNTYHYYDPRNSFLNEVLDRRTGIPITLSVVYLEVGWRLALPLAGVGMPSHFLVGYYGDAEPRFVDVFQQGTLLTRDDCAARLRAQYGAAFEVRDEHLAAVSKRQILVRMLTNLKLLYVQREDWDRALAAIDRVLLLQPDTPAELRDRGLLQFRRGAFRAASTDLERYLTLAPEAPDREAIRGQRDTAWRLYVARN